MRFKHIIIYVILYLWFLNHKIKRVNIKINIICLCIIVYSPKKSNKFTITSIKLVLMHNHIGRGSKLPLALLHLIMDCFVSMLTIINIQFSPCTKLVLHIGISLFCSKYTFFMVKDFSHLKIFINNSRNS